MADKDPAGDGPSLELPSFGFGRKKRRGGAEASTPEVPASPDPVPEVSPGSTPEVPASPDPGPEVAPGAEPEVPAAPAPDAAPPGRPEIEPLVPTAPDEPTRAPEIDPLVPTAPDEPTTAPEIDPVIPTRPEWQPPTEPDLAPRPEPTPETTPDPEPETLPDPHDPDPVAPPPPSGAVTAARGAEPGATDVLDASPVPATGREPRVRRDVVLPSLPPLLAVPAVGAVVGLVAVLLTWGSLRLCDVATGTASCGGGPGLLMLVAILIVLAYLGGWLLRGFGIADAGSTSVLAVGLVAVVAMLFLVDSLDEWSGAVLVVVVAVAAYALSWRVTAALVEAGQQ